MICSNCGKGNADDTSRCQWCGNLFSQTKPLTPVAPITQLVTPEINKPATAGSIPEGVKGWSWAAFLWTWIWAIGNKTWIGLLALLPIPGVALVMAIILGLNGREWSWKNKQWNSVEDFNRAQQNYVKWWFVLLAIAIVGSASVFFLASHQKHKLVIQNINVPASTKKNSFSNEKYSLTFNYPSNWIMTANPVDPSKVTAYSGNFDIGITDTKMTAKNAPICSFTIAIFDNPDNLSIKDWMNKNVNSMGSQTDSKQKEFADMLKQLDPKTINGIQGFTGLAGRYTYLKDKTAVYKIDYDRDHSECEAGYNTILNSLKIVR